MSICKEALKGSSSNISSWVKALEVKDFSWEVLLGEALGVKTLLVEALIWELSYVEAFVNFFLKNSYL